MKNVSLFKEVFEKVDGETLKLRAKTSDSIFKSNSIKYETKVPNLERMCYLMESVLLNKKREGAVYAGFQKLSRATGVYDRFLKIADNVDKIYIFGVPDTKLAPHPKIEIVPLSSTHDLTREWFLVMDIKFGKNMMVAYDLDGFGTKPLDIDRNFRGAKTLDIKLVDRAVNILNEVIN